ncbi:MULTISPECIES: SH3 domain-containing protein [Mesorhizobium]|uniref:SH3 domain-containing protein n=1 Tax=Mesorhizobium sp. GR13 TaxID=2562308 RepID=UPI001FDED1ED|nr:MULTISPECIES: SH3 domain-containing protein [Mesorhizobium]
MVGLFWRGLLAVALTATLAIPATFAQEVTPDTQPTGSIQRGPSGLPLPRFVSLKSGRVNVRTGPGINYAVEWLYLKAGLPMEILQEYDNWRRVRDSEGAEGWVNQSLLSGKRTALVAPWQKGKDIHINLMYEPDTKSSIVAILEPGVVGKIKTCNGAWCEATFDGNSGWISQSLIWGAYPDEQVGE